MRDILGLSPRYDMQVTLLERVKSCEKVSLAVSKLQEGKQSYFEELQLRLALRPGTLDLLLELGRLRQVPEARHPDKLAYLWASGQGGSLSPKKD